MDSFGLIILLVPPILFALTIHEYAHGWMANKLGDPTAQMMGRLTLNPLAHLDPIGTLMLFIVHIGWAKPVPVNPYNLRHPVKDMVWIAVAGPGANIVAAFFFGIILQLTNFSPAQLTGVLGVIFIIIIYCVKINLILAAFNIIPIPPLDGSKILRGLLPSDLAYEYAKLERYGPMILIAVIVLGSTVGYNPLWMFIQPFVNVFSLLFTGYDLSQF